MKIVPRYLEKCSCGDLVRCKICRSKYNRKRTLAKTPEEKQLNNEYARIKKQAMRGH